MNGNDDNGGNQQAASQHPACDPQGILRVEGTNVVRVPFGVRKSRRPRPERPDHWATLVLSFQAGGPNPTPPQAA
jgi:hypothetical protein